MQQSSCSRPRCIVSCAREWDERRTDLDGASPAKQHLPCTPGTAVSSQSPEPVPRKSTQIPGLGQKVLTSYCRPHSDRDLPPWTRVTFPSPKPFGRASPSNQQICHLHCLCDFTKEHGSPSISISTTSAAPFQQARLAATPSHELQELVVAGVGEIGAGHDDRLEERD
ncbi:hypothetical protein CI102_7619 [Trichoderma harzianum]|nr:hypothetical protein CI102_7619 [Trichoderma harzianum]